MISETLIQSMVAVAIAEDVGSGDITAALLPDDGDLVQARIITREAMVLCGSAFATEVFHQIDPKTSVTWLHSDGDVVDANNVLCEIKGTPRALLTAERCALNFVQMLSGTASLVRVYVNAIGDSDTQLLDTRKTIPNFRLAQKYAVQCGGGHNHRVGLYDAYLIKENHIMACGSISAAVDKARKLNPSKKIEVEVESLEELQQALSASVDCIMLDNFSLELIKQAVEMAQGKARLEVSGNVTLQNIAEYAKTGVDCISVGALTKHIRAVDLSMRIVKK
jgi:nicotinate-nucleotide pyrophosphorylase (carboxylating)